VILFEDKCLAAGSKRLGIAFEHGRRRGVVVNGEAVLSLGEHGAGDQPHEIDGIGHAGDFIEIVDAPNEPALGIPPRAEILHVKIADREQARRVRQFRTGLLPERRPAIEGRPQKGEERVLHVLMFQLEVGFDHDDVLMQPALIGLRGRNDRRDAACDLAIHRCVCR
jgi:hypothetical protein